jgi:hypothetical protein
VLKTSNSKSGHRLARPWGGWLRVAALTAGVAAASTAQAQDAGVAPGQQSGSVSVINPTRTVELRTTTPIKKQHWISHKDCVDDVELTFDVTVNLPSTSLSLVAYVGRSVSTSSSTTTQQSCLYAIARNNPSLCKPLTVKAQTATTGAPRVVIKAKALNALFGIDGCGESTSDDSTAPINLQFYFLLEPLAKDLGSGDNYAIYEGSGIDLWGPKAPTAVTPNPSDESLDVAFTDSSDSNGDTVGYRFYIDDGLYDGGTPPPPPTNSGSTSTSAGASSSTATSGGAGGGASTSTGTGTSTSAGVGGGTSTGAGTGGAMSTATGAGGGTSTGSGTSSSSSTAGGAGGVSGTVAATGGLSTGVTGGVIGDDCNPSAAPACTAASSVLFAAQVPGEDVNPTADSALAGVGTGTVTGLVNGKAYVVAVAAFDDVGNIGKLSELSCGTPQPLDVLLRVYKCKNGLVDSGCGFCSVGGDRGGSFAALVSAGLFMFGFAARRSRRPRAERGGR